MDIIDVYQDKAGQWRWRRKAPNHEIISSGECHARRWNALRAAERANQDKNWSYSQQTKLDDGKWG